MQTTLPPSQHVMFQYSRDLHDFGATSVRPSGPDAVVATFEPRRDWASPLLAAGALRDSVLGADLVIAGADGNIVPRTVARDMEFTPFDYARFIERNPRVASARPTVDVFGNPVLRVRAHTPEGATHLAGLIRDQVGPGLPVEFTSQPWVRPVFR